MRDAGKLTADDMIIVGQGFRARLVRVGNISTIEADKNDIVVHSNGAEPLTMRGSLSHCKRRLPSQFFCASRGCLVNLAEVSRVNMASRVFILTMRDGQTVQASRLQSRAFRKAFSL